MPVDVTLNILQIGIMVLGGFSAVISITWKIGEVRKDFELQMRDIKGDLDKRLTIVETELRILTKNNRRENDPK